LFRRIVEYFVYCRAKHNYRFFHSNAAKLSACGVEVTAAAKLFRHTLNVYTAIRARGNTYYLINGTKRERRLYSLY
jgi:hypothetical protein